MTGKLPEPTKGNRLLGIGSAGLVATAVCAPKDMSNEDIEAEVNRNNPTGISPKWRISESPLENGITNPWPCPDDETRQHFILNC